MEFEIHPNLAKKAVIADLPLCRVLLQDESSYTWIILVPRRQGIRHLIDLTPSDQLQLLEEMNRSQHILMELFNPEQLNVAALGNKTPQLHIHVIGRHSKDPAWPNTVWDHSHPIPYNPMEKEIVLNSLKKAFYN